MQAVIFVVFAAAALCAAVGMVLARNPVHSALLLVVVMVAIAVFFLQQQAHLLAAVQIIVYASAIVVLFLFVIMLLGIDRHEQLWEPLRLQRPAAVTLGAVVLGEIVFLAGHEWATGAQAETGHSITAGGADPGNVERVARSLFTDFLWPFELTSALLVIAVVGSVVLARRSGHRVEIVDEGESDLADPLGGMAEPELVDEGAS